MRKIGIKEIEDISVGAALLGTGGGGDPYIGKLMAIQAIEEFGEVTLLNVDEVPEDALVVPSSMMGAPTVMLEKPPGGEEAIEAFKKLENYLGKKIYGTFPIEAGGVNSMLPFALAARLGLPVIDADGMGRAFPELQMVTFYLDDIPATPGVFADERGNTLLLSTIDNVWTERIARSATVQMGGSTMVAMYSMTGKQLKNSGIPNILDLEENIGKTIRLAKENNQNPITELLRLVDGFQLFSGKVADIHRKTETGFARGTATFEGLNDDKGKTLQVHFQNEHLLAQSDGRTLCSTPDLIAVLDIETGLPITTEGIRYGARCVVIGIPCNPKWRTEKGIKTVGPRYFGYDLDYVPVEQLVINGVAK
ncbi:DUF917 domain-containing protein [Neobacillus niacini]|uniref:DUF917 domain-containing protein n=1 Tax=Neobacillus niacini TaxID=86668 RepID=UPI002FFDA6B1